MSNNGRHWRSKLLVDMSTGQVTIDKQNHEHTSSDRFISNSYDPTGPQSTDRSSPLISNIEDPDNYEDIVSLDSSLMNTCFENISMGVLTKNGIELDSQSTVIEEVLHSLAEEPENEDEATNENSADPNLILDEITGLLIPSTATSTSIDGNYVLEEETGEFKTIESAQPYDEETDIEIYNHRKSRSFNKKQRLQGKKYMGRKRVSNNNSFEYVQKRKREKKEKPCMHGVTLKTSRSYRCGEICDEQREVIFTYFWNLDSWDGKKAYIKNLIRKRPILKKRKEILDNTAIQNGFDYSLLNSNNELIRVFCAVLKEEKISIYQPRKDQCDTCTAYKEGNLSETEYKHHYDMKNEAYEAKRQAISQCSPEVLIVTMDVQGVLLCPKLNVSVQYYKQKLQLRNFTVYCNNNKEVHLFVWHEGAGGVTANDFVSCIVLLCSVVLLFTMWRGARGPLPSYLRAWNVIERICEEEERVNRYLPTC